MDDQDHYSVDDSGATAIADDIAERIGVDKATAILLHETLIEQTWRADDEGCEPDGGLPPASIGAMKGRLARVAEYSDDELDACADEALVALKGAGWSCRRCGGPWPPGSLCEQCDYQNRLLEDLVLEPMVEQGILEHDGVDDEGRIVYKSLVYEGNDDDDDQ